MREAQTLKHLFVVAAALYDEKADAWLMAEHQKREDLRGLWEFPGGKVEKGESPEQALIREMEEELGITVQQAHLEPLTFLSHAYPEYDFHLMMPLYKINQWQGEIQSKLGQKFCWVQTSDLENKRESFLPANKPLIDWIVKHKATL